MDPRREMCAELHTQDSNRMTLTNDQLQTRLGTCLPLPQRSRFPHHKSHNIKLRLTIALTSVITSIDIAFT